MAREEEKLKLGQGASFVKGRLRRLRQEGVTWEADFRALPRPMGQGPTNYRGLVVTQADGSLLADSHVEGRPTVNDMANLLAQAMRHPSSGNGRRPTALQVRGHPQWRELFSHLAEIAVEVSVRQELPHVERAYREHLRRLDESHRVGLVKPTREQLEVEKLFPAVARWVLDGHIEVGDQEGFGFVVRALDSGGTAFEDDRPRTLGEALAALEKGLRAWFKGQGIELEEGE